MTDEVKKKCFVISPIGDEGTPVRNAADWFLEGIVRVALGDTFAIERADEERKTGLITNHIIQKIQSADLVVAELTGHNPNVHYELGVAHALSKHVVPMIIRTERLPFDNAPIRTIFYSRDHPRDQAAAVAALKAAADAEMSGQVQNPVTHALGILQLPKGDDRNTIIKTMAVQIIEQAGEIANLRKATDMIVEAIFPSTRANNVGLGAALGSLDASYSVRHPIIATSPAAPRGPIVTSSPPKGGLLGPDPLNKGRRKT